MSRRQRDIAISDCAHRSDNIPPSGRENLFLVLNVVHIFTEAFPTSSALEHRCCTCDAGSRLCPHGLLFSGLTNVRDAHNSLPRDQSDALQIASFPQPNAVHRLSWVTKASCKCLAFLPEK